MCYKFFCIIGLFCSNVIGLFDYCYLFQEFGFLFFLNSFFISEDLFIDCVIVIFVELYFIVDFWCDMRYVRLMFVYGIFGMIDYF